MPFKRFLRAFKIHSRTLKPMYWVAKNDSTYFRIMMYIKSHICNFPIHVYHPDYLDGFTVLRYDDDVYDFSEYSED